MRSSPRNLSVHLALHAMATLQSRGVDCTVRCVCMQLILFIAPAVMGGMRHDGKAAEARPGQPHKLAHAAPEISQLNFGATAYGHADAMAAARNVSNDCVKKTSRYAHLQAVSHGATDRWGTGTSICNQIPGLEARNTFPVRSPFMVVDFLMSRILCARVVEIGSRNGDIISCMKHFASQVTSIEMEQRYCDSLRSRGIDVVCAQLHQDNVFNVLPEADVYFYWMLPDLNMRLVSLLHSALAARQQTAQVIFLIDEQSDQGEAGKVITELKHAGLSFGGKVHRIFFDETVDEQQAITGRPVADEGNGASYKAEYYGRYGRWGVLSAFVVDIGVPQEGSE